MIDGGKIIAYGFNMVISEILTWKITVTVNLIFSINARLRRQAGEPLLSAQCGQAGGSTADKPSQHTWIHAAAAMIAAAEADTTKTSS